MVYNFSGLENLSIIVSQLYSVTLKSSFLRHQVKIELRIGCHAKICCQLNQNLNTTTNMEGF